MPDKLIVEGVPPYDGEYEFDVANLVDSFTMGELHRIKRLTGLRAGELGEAFDAGDTDLAVAVACVILERNGKRVVDDLLWNAKTGGLRIELGDDDDPPAKAPKGAKTASGKSGKESSESSPESDPSPTGDPS